MHFFVVGSLSSEDFDEFGLDDMVEWLFQPKTNEDIFWKLLGLEYQIKEGFCRIKPPWVYKGHYNIIPLLYFKGPDLLRKLHYIFNSPLHPDHNIIVHIELLQQFLLLD